MIQTSEILSTSNPATQSAYLAAKQLGQFGHAQKSAIVRNEMVGSSVSLLFFSRSPSAVVWLVITIIVDAFKRVKSRGSLPHVGQKVPERLAPSLAYRDPATTIVVPVRTVSVAASLFHVLPNAVFGMRLLLSTPIAQASAALLSSSQKVVRRCVKTPSALAQAFHATVCSAVHCSILGQDNNGTKPTTDNLFGFDRLRPSHDRLLIDVKGESRNRCPNRFRLDFSPTSIQTS